MEKSLGTNLHNGRFYAHVRCEYNFTCLTSPPTLIQWWKLIPSVSSDFQKLNDNSSPSPKSILRVIFSDYNSSMVNLVFYMVTVCSEIWFRPSSCTSFPVLNYGIIKTCNEMLEITRKLTCSNFLEILPQTNRLVSKSLCSVLSNISNTRNSVSSGYPNTEKRVESTTRSGVFLTKFEVLGLPMKHCLKCLIYLLNWNNN